MSAALVMDPRTALYGESTLANVHLNSKANFLIFAVLPLAPTSATPHPACMESRRLGRSGLNVSCLGLGTMTFGSQATEAESLRIMDHAFDAGIFFFDTAELYPVPPDIKLLGRTEEIIGKWLRDKDRDEVVIASKVAGPGHGWFPPPVRHGRGAIDRHHIRSAIEDSLRRLGTDFIDLYQIHWPDHGMRAEDTLAALTELIDEGKVRAIGSSNDTCWGIMNSERSAERHNTARYDSVQNNFSLINRRCESELAQVCRREQISLLPYSPLGGGVLTGKYNTMDGLPPGGARFSQYLTHGNERQQRMARRFVNPRTLATVDRLQEIANSASLSLTTLSIAWSKQHDFVASSLFGVTSAEQLPDILAAADITLDKDILNAIDAMDEEIPNPMTEDGLRRL